MDKIRLKDKEFELLIPEKEIKDAIAKMAKQIKADVGDTNPLFVGILNGAFMFTAELMRQMDTYYENYVCPLFFLSWPQYHRSCS